jgi:hypothetical protein
VHTRPADSGLNHVKLIFSYIWNEGQVGLTEPPVEDQQTPRHPKPALGFIQATTAKLDVTL